MTDVIKDVPAIFSIPLRVMLLRDVMTDVIRDVPAMFSIPLRVMLLRDVMTDVIRDVPAMFSIPLRVRTQLEMEIFAKPRVVVLWLSTSTLELLCLPF